MRQQSIRKEGPGVAVTALSGHAYAPVWLQTSPHTQLMASTVLRKSR